MHAEAQQMFFKPTGPCCSESSGETISFQKIDFDQEFFLGLFNLSLSAIPNSCVLTVFVFLFSLYSFISFRLSRELRANANQIYFCWATWQLGFLTFTPIIPFGHPLIWIFPVRLLHKHHLSSLLMILLLHVKKMIWHASLLQTHLTVLCSFLKKKKKSLHCVFRRNPPLYLRLPQQLLHVCLIPLLKK